MSEQRDNTLLNYQRLKLSPGEFNIWVIAWEKYPVLKSDCRTTREFKRLARDDYFKKLKLEHA